MRIRLVLFTLLFALAGPASAWQLRQDDAGIQIWTQRAADGPHEVKAQMTVPAAPDAVLAVLQNYEDIAWRGDMLERMQVIERPSKDTILLQVEANPPWPLSDSTSIVETRISREADGTIVYAYENRGDLLPPDAPRPPADLEGEWRLAPVAEGTEVTHVVEATPNVAIPGWLLDRLIYRQPRDQFTNLREKLASE